MATELELLTQVKESIEEQTNPDQNARAALNFVKAAIELLKPGAAKITDLDKK